MFKELQYCYLKEYFHYIWWVIKSNLAQRAVFLLLKSSKQTVSTKHMTTRKNYYLSSSILDVFIAYGTVEYIFARAGSPAKVSIFFTLNLLSGALQRLLQDQINFQEDQYFSRLHWRRHLWNWRDRCLGGMDRKVFK